MDAQTQRSLVAIATKYPHLVSDPESFCRDIFNGLKAHQYGDEELVSEYIICFPLFDLNPEMDEIDEDGIRLANELAQVIAGLAPPTLYVTAYDDDDALNVMGMFLDLKQANDAFDSLVARFPGRDLILYQTCLGVILPDTLINEEELRRSK
jgi:hypothetical protein